MPTDWLKMWLTLAPADRMAGNEPDAKAILPEPRSVQKAISYQ
jgi:hypothetical protein